MPSSQTLFLKGNSRNLCESKLKKPFLEEIRFVLRADLLWYLKTEGDNI